MSSSKTLHLDAKREADRAPKFEMANWAECCNSNQVAEVYSQYGQQPTARLPPKRMLEYGATRNATEHGQGPHREENEAKNVGTLSDVSKAEPKSWARQ